MIINSDPVFDSALALPVPLRAELAAKLIESLESVEANSAISGSLRHEIEAASDELHRGEADLVEGEEALAIIQAAIDRAAAKK
jgi:hypothetical protein